MSFIKIKDPRKREELIKDFIETRKRIKDNFVAQKVGEAEYQTGLTKLFKPVTETQKATAKEITEAQKEATERIEKGLLPIKEGIEGLPGALSFPTLEMTEGEPVPAVEMTPEQRKKILGPIASEAFEKYTTSEGADKVFGMVKKDKYYYIGDKPIKIKGDNIIIDNKEYTGTEGLWELIVSKEPKTIYTEDDFLNYGRILKQTNAIFQNNNPNQNKPKSSVSPKWKNLIKPIWEDIKKSKKPPEEEKGKGKGKGRGRKKRQEDPQPGTSGDGLKILPSDPNALIDRFDLLFSSKKAGHTGVKNEIVSILDELKRQGVININEYKKLNSLIKK